jgi:hypothetical protein
MLGTSSFGGCAARRRSALLALLLPILIGVTATNAGATMRIVNHNDPAGDPAAIAYTFSSPTFSPPRTFVLGDGENITFGGFPGPYTAQALPPVGWTVGDIQCVGPRGPQDFTVDVPNGRVTIVHVDPVNDNQTCAFTLRRRAAGGAGAAAAPAGPGVAPSPPAAELPALPAPRTAALLGVTPKRGFAIALLRLVKRSIVKAQLVQAGRVVATRRLVLAAGTHSLRVTVPSKVRRQVRRQGRNRTTVTLRIVVVERPGATHVFTYRALVAV